MLTYRWIETENFQVLAGVQRVDIAERGVTVFYGENGFGKTTVLNAFRFAFLGKVLDRSGQPRPLASVPNRETNAHQFRVTLAYEIDGVAFELTRIWRGDSSGGHDSRQEVFLRRGSDLVGPQERDQLLRQAMPDDLARFFLFDGEQLLEYEQLVVSGSDEGKKLSQEIERILGVPILQQAERSLRLLADQAQSDLAREAAKNEKTKSDAVLLTTLTEQREQHRRDAAGHQQKIDAASAEIARDQQLLEEQAANVGRAAERDGLKRAIQDLDEQAVAARAELREATTNLWRAALADRARQVLNDTDAAYRHALRDIENLLRSDVIDTGACGVCDRPVDADHRERLRETLPRDRPQGEKQVFGALKGVVARAALLASYSQASADQTTAAWTRISEIEIKRFTKAEQLRRVENEIHGLSLDDVRAARANVERLREDLITWSQTLSETQAKIEATNGRIDKLTEAIKHASHDDGRAQAVQERLALLSRAASLFHTTIDAYRADLRIRVQDTASDFHGRMTTEQRGEYAGLRINDAYGLTIEHKDGRLVEGRSAGQEHVVALALMAALQRNAPIKGPIAMDSPLGRLDKGHKERVIRALPEIAPQVLLLVHSAEAEPQDMREGLGTHLGREYRLQSLSSWNTQITVVQ